jgi:hypothetical protein
MMARMMWQAFKIDVRSVLAGVRTPTMVLARREDRIASIEGAEALAAGIPNAQLRELLPGEHYAVDLIDLLPKAVLEFVGRQANARHAERVLSAVLSPTSSARPNCSPRRATIPGPDISTTTIVWSTGCWRPAAAGESSPPATGSSRCSTA